MRLVGHLGRAAAGADRTASDCLADMAADAIAYRRAAADCPRCSQGPAADCTQHSPDHALIESYRQLAADLISAGGGR
jgi:hypothetical protein